MSDVVSNAVSAATPANSAESSATESTAVDSLDSPEALDAAEAELDAAEGSSEEASEVKAKDPKELAKAKKEIEKRIKKLKLKVDGKEIEEEVNLDDDEYLTRQLQMAKMGQKRAQEKAELEGEFRKFFQALQSDPMELLSKEFNMNPEELIEAYINKQLEHAKKTPEQIEREKLETELRSLREEREKEKQTLQQKELERLQQQEFERYDMLMEQALNKSGIPRNPYYVKKIADLMLVGISAGMDVVPEDVIPLVKEEMETDLKEILQAMPEEAVEALLGEQTINKLRKRRVAKAQETKKALGDKKIVETGKSSKTEKDDKGDTKINYRNFFGV